MSDELHDNAVLLEGFYAALTARDFRSMGAAYSDDATFSDPVFSGLTALETRAMWHMLCEQGTDLLVTHSDVTSDGDTGSARWEARYSFGPEARYVHNRISATFRFRDGLILEHTDDFDLWKWTRMAVGTIGVIGGWSNFVQSKVRSTANHSLERFIEAHPEYQ
ncbi:MAG: nuclear transport factor 2 family protein [Acidimicrobiia bacterium]